MKDVVNACMLCASNEVIHNLKHIGLCCAEEMNSVLRKMVGNRPEKSKIAPESPCIVLFQVCWRKHCAADPGHLHEFDVFAPKNK